MSVAPITSSNISAFPSLSLPRPVGIAQDIDDAPQVDRAGVAEQTARIAAQNAEQWTSQINKFASLYNSLSDETIQKTVDATRTKYGNESADRQRDMMLRTRADCISLIQGNTKALSDNFNISGPACSYDAKTDTYSAANFTASANLGDSAVLFDSTKGPQLSVMGSEFTANFTRNYLPDVQYLGYSLDGKQLFDLEA